MPVTLNRKDNSVVIPKIKWHRLKDPSADHFVNDMQDKLIEILETSSNQTANQMWNDFYHFCHDKAVSTLGISKGKFKDERETWWWNGSVQRAVNEKKTCFKQWKLAEQDPEKTEEEKKQLRDNYKFAKKRSKVAVAKSREEASQSMYDNLESPEAQQSIYRIAKQRERKAKDIRNAKYIRDDQGTLLTDDIAIQERWKSYYSRLLNEEFTRSPNQIQHPVSGPIVEVSPEEVKHAIMKMKNGKATGPDEIPAEFWKRTDQIGCEWLATLFNKILFFCVVGSEGRLAFVHFDLIRSFVPLSDFRLMFFFTPQLFQLLVEFDYPFGL